MRRSQGATLLELMTAIAVLGVLWGLAAPSFSSLHQNSARTAAVNDFVHAIFLARSEAVTRGSIATICKTVDGESCTYDSPDWATGWMVFANDDGDDPPQRDPEERVIQVYQGWRGGHITSNRKSYSFRPYIQGVINGTVLFCDRRGNAEARALIVNHAGRPRVSTRDSSNKPLRCPPS